MCVLVTSGSFSIFHHFLSKYANSLLSTFSVFLRFYLKKAPDLILRKTQWYHLQTRRVTMASYWRPVSMGGLYFNQEGRVQPPLLTETVLEQDAGSSQHPRPPLWLTLCFGRWRENKNKKCPPVDRCTITKVRERVQWEKSELPWELLRATEEPSNTRAKPLAAHSTHIGIHALMLVSQ